jgi:hypothetical protein
MRFLLTLVGLAFGSAVPALAQEQNTVNPEVRQQIEAVLVKFDEAFNKNDAAATAALFTQDAVHVIRTWSEGGLASGQQAIEKRLAVEFASSVPATCHTSFFRCMQSAMTYARSRNGVCRRLIPRAITK